MKVYTLFTYSMEATVGTAGTKPAGGKVCSTVTSLIRCNIIVSRNKCK